MGENSKRNNFKLKKIKMKTKLNQSAAIFFKGNICKFIKWETINSAGKLKVKIDKKFIEVDILELTN